MIRTAVVFSAFWVVLSSEPLHAREDAFCAPYGTHFPYFAADFTQFGVDDPDYEFLLHVTCACREDPPETEFQFRCERDQAGYVCAWHDLGHPSCTEGLATLEKWKEPGAPRYDRGIVRFDLDDALASGMRITLPSNRDLSFSLSHRDFGPLREDILGVTFERDGEIELRTSVPSGHVYDRRRPGCVSSDSIASGWVSVSYPESVAAEIVALGQTREWETYGTDFEEDTSSAALVGLLDCASGWNDPDICHEQIRVGPGMELDAIVDLNALDDRICATWQGVGKGGLLGLRVIELPLRSLLDPADPDPAAVATRLDTLLAEEVFGEGVGISPVVPVRIGNDFATRLRAPGPHLGVDNSEGYWFDIDLAISVGLTLGANGLSEEVDISILDVIEVRAPETLDNLPPGLLRSGRSVAMYSERQFDKEPTPDGALEIIIPELGETFGLELNEDGLRFAKWQQVIGTRVARALGGQVLGGL